MRRQGAATMEVIRAAAEAAAEMGVDTILMVAPPLKRTSNTLTANLGTTKDATRSSKPYARKKEICREGREMVGTINCLKLLCPPQCLSPKASFLFLLFPPIIFSFLSFVQNYLLSIYNSFCSLCCWKLMPVYSIRWRIKFYGQ